MNITFLWLGISIAIVFLVIGFFCGQRKANVEQIKENETIKQIEEKRKLELYKTESDIEKAKSNLEELNKSFAEKNLNVQAKLNELDWQLNNKKQSISRHLDEVKDIKFSKINQCATDYRRKLFEDINFEISVQQERFNDWKKNLNDQFTKISDEIGVLRASRDALIEANRREEEKKLQKDFYRIVLTTENFEDIKLLKSIEKFLFNKDPLYKLIWNTFYMSPTKEMLNRIIGKEKTSGIYKITNETNNKVYIGQSVDLHGRLTNHIKAALGIATIAHQQIHDAMAADGLENFTFEIVEKCPKEHLNKKEKLWIETYASDKYGYNRTAGGAKEE